MIISDYCVYVNNYLLLSRLFVIIYDYFLIVCNYLWLFYYVNVVCINAGMGQLFFEKHLEKWIWLMSKLWIISTNSVIKLQILYFSIKNKENKKLKYLAKKSALISAFIHTTTSWQPTL